MSLTVLCGIMTKKKRKMMYQSNQSTGEGRNKSPGGGGYKQWGGGQPTRALKDYRGNS